MSLTDGFLCLLSRVFVIHQSFLYNEAKIETHFFLNAPFPFKAFVIFVFQNFLSILETIISALIPPSLPSI